MFTLKASERGHPRHWRTRIDQDRVYLESSYDGLTWTSVYNSCAQTNGSLMPWNFEGPFEGDEPSK